MPADRGVDGDMAERLSMAIAPLARQIRQRVESPFTATQLSVVGAIRRHAPITVGELAEVEGLTAGTVSKVLSALEEHGVIAREYDADDRRICRVQVSPDGERWFVDHRGRRAKWLASQLDQLDAGDVDAIQRALPALERLIDLGQ